MMATRLTLLLVLALAALMVCSTVAAPSKNGGFTTGGVWSFARFLEGFWLVRPLPVENALTQYTHRMMAVEGQYDGGVTITINKGGAQLPSFIASAWEWLDEASAPFWALFVHRDLAAARKKLAAAEVDLSLQESRAAIRRAVNDYFGHQLETFRVAVEGGESPFAGKIILTGYANQSVAEQHSADERAGDEEDEASLSRQPPAGPTPVVAAFTAEAAYEFKVSPTSTHHLKVATGTCAGLAVPTPPPPFETLRCTTWQATVTDADNLLLTVVFEASSSSGCAAGSSTVVTAPVSLVLRRDEESNEAGDSGAAASKATSTIVYTVIMLVIVAIVKFLPRILLEWQGFDTHKVVKGHQRLSKLPEAERKRVLMEQFERIKKEQDAQEARLAAEEKTKSASRESKKDQ